MSRYKLIEGTSRKFWEESLRGTRLVVRWGRIRTKGQSKTFESRRRVKGSSGET
jgi:predicted DNA-binding WGR domain protein